LQLALWVEMRPEVPDGDWYKDFGSFKICGNGSYPKTFLVPQAKLIEIRDADRAITHPLEQMLPYPVGQAVPAFELRH